jgi:hypothetical protein
LVQATKMAKGGVEYPTYTFYYARMALAIS